MPKKEDIGYGIVIVFVLIVIILINLASGFTITGFAAKIPGVDMTDVKLNVASFAAANPMARYAGVGANMCLLIDFGNENIYSFDIEKTSGTVEVSESPNSIYCDGLDKEDIVIKYTSYDAFLKSVKSPSCNTFVKGSGKDFIYFPSKLVKEGGEVICNEEFVEKYCPVVEQCLSNWQLQARGFNCCPGAKKILDPKLFSDEYFWYSIIGIVVLVIVIAAGMFLLEERKEEKEIKELIKEEHMGQLQNYIFDALYSGHSKAEIRKHLESLGWPDDVLDKAFKRFE